MFKGLFTKIYGLILVPTIAFFAMTFIFTMSNYKQFELNQLINKKIPIIRASVNLLSTLQIERGLSISFLSGVQNKSKVFEHRKKVDEVLSHYQKVIKLTHAEKRFDKEKIVLSALDLREKIMSKKTTIKNVSRLYTRAIRALMDKIKIFKSLINNNEVSSSITNLIELSEAKENGGLLRANVSSLIGKNKPITDDDFNLITVLNSNFQSYSISKVFKFQNKNSLNLYNQFLSLPEHKSVKKAVYEVLDRRNVSFAINPELYFEDISKVLTNLNKTIHADITFLESKSDLLFKTAKRNLIILIVSVLLYLFITLYFTRKVVMRLVKEFRENLHTLNNRTHSINLLNQKLNKVTTEVSRSSQSQASDTQAISSASRELSQTITINNNLLSNISDEIQLSNNGASRGKNQALEMKSSISGISEDNQNLVDQIQKNNKEFEKISQMINQIASKTLIINDIVFQTKLLSFNASVEAARAGEDGKGFAVVAEEIGNLASSSGNAANEIEELVSSSKNMVKDLTESMVERIDFFISRSNSSVESGIENAANCLKNFEDLFEQVHKVSEYIENFQSSSLEQVKTVKEITENIEQLELATNLNLKSVETNLNASSDIVGHTKSLKKVVDSMCIIIRGEVIKEKKLS